MFGCQVVGGVVLGAFWEGTVASFSGSVAGALTAEECGSVEGLVWGRGVLGSVCEGAAVVLRE